VRRAWLVLLAVALATVWIASGIGQLRSEFNIESSLPKNHPLVEIDRTGHLASNALRYEDGGFALPPEGAAIRVTHGRRLLGRMVLVPGAPHGTTRAERRVGVALADQLAVAAARNTTLHPLT